MTKEKKEKKPRKPRPNKALVYANAEEYMAELKEVLHSFDVEKLKKFVSKHRRYYSFLAYSYSISKKDDFWEGILAKMILQLDDVTEEESIKAKKILDNLGWDYSIGEHYDENDLL